MSVHRAYLGLAAAFLLSSCFLTRVGTDDGCMRDDQCEPGQLCTDAMCVGGVDAGFDAAGFDAGDPDAGFDAGTDATLVVDTGTDAGTDAGPEMFSPVDLAPLGMWDTLNSTITHTGGEVSFVTNVGTAGPILDLSQTVASLQPDLIIASPAMNNVDSLHFDGGDVLDSVPTPVWELSADGDDLTVISVHVADTVTSSWLLGTDAHTSGGFALAVDTDGAMQRALTYDDGATGLLTFGPTTVVSTIAVAALVVSGGVSPDLDVVQYWNNGVPETQQMSDLGTIGQSGSEAICWGSTHSSGNSGTSGEMGLFLLFHRLLTPAEDARLTTYVNTTWGTTFPGITQ